MRKNTAIVLRHKILYPKGISSTKPAEPEGQRSKIRLRRRSVTKGQTSARLSHQTERTFVDK